MGFGFRGMYVYVLHDLDPDLSWIFCLNSVFALFSAVFCGEEHGGDRGK